MKQVMGMGLNRTGIKTSPIDAKSIIESAEKAIPAATGDGAGIAAMRAEYARIADPVGSVPPPASVKGVAQTANDMLMGVKPAVLIDLLSQRLAFERTGTRMYEALIAKMVSVGVPPSMSLGAVQRFHDEERAHMDLVKRAIERLGGDPTVQTPWADVDGVASMGLLQVIGDPRTSVVQSLHAIHVAELADGDGWGMLVNLAARTGHTELVEAFDVAVQQEAFHLATVREWMSDALMADAGVAIQRT